MQGKTQPPDYIVHEVNEKDVTVDWFFARGRGRHRLAQLGLIVIGWFFAILPIVITASALIHQHDPQHAWWSYREGFHLWHLTIHLLAILAVAFIVVFLVLYLVNRSSRGERARRETYDSDRLQRRLELAAVLYENKYGAQSFRMERKRIDIEPHGDFETYELRDSYREYGVG